MKMNRYELANAKHLVEGYYFPCISKSGTNKDEFERARSECVANLKKQLKQVESLTIEQFNGKSS